MTDTDLPVVNREAPEGYRWPGAEVLSAGVHYWLEPQPGWTGATSMFMVMGSGPDGRTIMAEKCSRTKGVVIVDALRAADRIRSAADALVRPLGSPRAEG